MDYFGDGTDYSAWGATDVGSDYTPDASWQSYTPTDLMTQFQPDILASQGMYPGGADPLTGMQANPQAAYDPSQSGGLNTPNFVTNRAGVPVGIDPATGQPTGGLYSQGPLGMGGFGAPNASGLFGAPGGFLNALTSPQSLLGIGGGLAGLIGTLAGGGVTGTTTPRIPTNAMANLGQANQALQPFALGQTPAQQQQMSLLQAIMSGQGLAQPYAQAVEQSFQPQLGSLYQQAVDQGRSRGFFDAPATSPAGGAVLGPGLADLQGQEATAKLNLMQSLPELYNQPIQTQANAAANQASGLLTAAQTQTGKQQSAPLGTQIGTAFGAGLQGIGQGIGQQQQQAQQSQNNSLLNTLLMNQANQTNMSGSGGYTWQNYGGL